MGTRYRTHLLLLLLLNHDACLWRSDTQMTVG